MYWKCINVLLLISDTIPLLVEYIVQYIYIMQSHAYIQIYPDNVHTYLDRQYGEY